MPAKAGKRVFTPPAWAPRAAEVVQKEKLEITIAVGIAKGRNQVYIEEVMGCNRVVSGLTC